MKVMIVDDEAHVITAVKLLVPWNELGITQILEASNPQDAIRIMEQEQPEILITDIVMQDLSGIDLMEYVNHAPFHTKVVVISGYNNFEYVRGSLQNGGIDYLLKPLDQNQLIAAVKKAVCSWNEEESLRSAVQSHADKIHSMTALCKENLLSKLLAGEQPEQTYRELIQLCPELGSQPAYGFACCLLKPFAPNQDELSVFRDMLGTFGEDTKAGFLLPSGDSQEILFFLSNPASEILNQLEQHLTEWNAQFSFPVSMGLSLSGTFPNKLKETLAQSKKAYGCLDSVSLTPVLCRIDGFSSNFLEHHPLLPSSEEKDRWLLSALLTGNEELVDQKIDNWLNYRLGTSHPQLENVLQVIEEEKQLFTNWAHMFEKRHQGFYHQSSYRLCCYADVCDSGFSFSFSKFKHRIHMDIFFLYQELKDFHSPESDMIYQVAHYLELNYNQPFSQFACAQMFYVNKEYLCRKFKNTFHISMVTYLNDLRINHAKRLLEDSSIKIRQIAHEVGYEDEKYFSRQFKKVTGMTPNEYRLNSLLT
ncbi:MAG: helix-turn-helix domain-containing protein [Lachnospiraceae bacterium]